MIYRQNNYFYGQKNHFYLPIKYEVFLKQANSRAIYDK